MLAHCPRNPEVGVTSGAVLVFDGDCGVCDAGMISNGAVPEQQFSTLIPYMVKTYGKKVYTIAADYNFGQISAEGNRKLVKEQGGRVVGRVVATMMKSSEPSMG